MGLLYVVNGVFIVGVGALLLSAHPNVPNRVALLVGMAALMVSIALSV
jgi:hypothetical protein